MLYLNDFKILEKIYSNPNSIIFRGVRVSDNKKVLLKTHTKEVINLKEKARIKYEYHFLKSLNLPHILPFALDLVEEDNKAFLILEDEGYEPLNKRLKSGLGSLKAKLELSINIAEALGDLHDQNVIHQDIKPENIILKPNTLLIKLIDFGSATRMRNEQLHSELSDQTFLTFNYMSPEQTGRMNRTIDFRTDFYSLGVTLYEIFTEQLPFIAVEPLEIFHCHLAVKPIQPHLIKPRLPLVISNIIMKLLEKNAEDRYQSASGLIYDLKYCLSQFLEKEKIEEFELGKKDYSTQFYIKEKLYGRENEVSMLVQEFEKTATASCNQLIFITGHSGIGKSALINEIAKPCAQRQSFFIKGKFEQYSKDLPFQPLAKGFANLVYEILQMSDSKIEEWKQKILDAVGSNGRLLIEIIPELKSLIGEQPPILEVGIEETENRFFNTFLNFISIFSSKNKPFVIFLNDLQWAPLIALKFIEKIILTDLFNNTLIIGSFRENEVNLGHPLLEVISEIEKIRSYEIKRISLHNLDKEDINRLILDSFKMDPLESEALSEICLKKTAGNPFFLKQFLKLLYQKKFISCDNFTGQWKPDIGKIIQEDITDNVIEFFIEKLSKLDLISIEILKIASCAGKQFDLALLEELISENRTKLINSLIFLKKQDFIFVSEGSLEYSLEYPSLNVNLHFLHDKIRESAHKMIPEEEKKEIHLKIARSLVRASHHQEIEILQITFHYNQSLKLITNSAELLAVAKFNLQSTQKARKTANYSAALNYCKAGLKILSFLDKIDLQLEIELNKELALCQFLNGLYEDASATYDNLIPMVNSNYEKAEIYISKMEIFTLLHEFNKNIEIIGKLFSLFNIHLKTSNASIVIEFLKTKILFILPENKKAILKKSEDQASLLLAKGFFNVCSTLILSGNKKYLLFYSLKLIQLAFHSGSTLGTSLALLFFSSVMGSLGIYRDEHYFAALCKKTLDLNQNATDLYVKLIYYLFLYHRFNPFKEAIEPLTSIFLKAKSLGSWETAVVSFHQRVNMMFHAGYNLQEIISQIEINYPFILEINEKDEINCIIFIYQNLISLAGKPTNVVEKFQKIEIEAINIKEIPKFPKIYVLYSLYSMITSTIFKRYKEAYQHIKKLVLFYEAKMAEGMFIWTSLFFMEPLVIIQLLYEADFKEKTQLQRELDISLKRLKNCAEHYPVNMENKYLIVQAELAAYNKKDIKALELYEKAINITKKKGFIHELALVNELTASFLIKLNIAPAAYGYLNEAYNCYYEWGATEKTQLLVTHYPQVFSHLELYEEGISSATSDSSRLINTLDLNALLRASQVIKRESNFEELIINILNIIVQSSGAEKVILLLFKGEELFINGSFSTQEKIPQSLEIVHYMNSKNLSHQVIDLVKTSGKYVVEADISNNEKFMLDPYIKKSNLRSVLCYPLKKSGEFVGILYLENNLTKGAFTNKHLSVLDVLSGEIATMLEMANSFRAFERFVPKEFIIPLGKTKITDVNIGDFKEVKISILFADIRSFTVITEKLISQETFDLLNRMFSYINPIILARKGFIDKYLGDAVMAIFSESADEALASAIEMQRAVSIHQKEIVGPTGVSVKIGIGLNSGYAILGVLGSSSHMDTTVISDAVNISSRLESLTKVYGAQILISENFLDSLNFPENFYLSYVDTVILKGKSQDIKIYEVFVPETINPVSLKQSDQIFVNAWQKYASGEFEVAKELFSSLKNAYPDSNRIDLFIHRCEIFLKNGSPKGWNGTTILKDK